MEMKIDSYIKEQFDIKEVDIKTYSPLALAYIGLTIIWQRCLEKKVMRFSIEAM